MARHSHFHNIMLKKGALDKARGKVFTKHARLIAVAVRNGGGGDPESNAMLRMAIENARADNVPRDNIERAVKKGTGASKEGMSFEEVNYEAFGPAGTALIISCVTDNKNRTKGQLHKILTEYGGRLSEAGTTAWMFEQKGEIRIKSSGNLDDDELKCIDAGAEDIEKLPENEILIYTKPQNLALVRKNLEKAGFSILSAELNFVAKDYIKIEDPQVAKKILSLMESLEEEEDVSKTAANFEIPEDSVD